MDYRDATGSLNIASSRDPATGAFRVSPLAAPSGSVATPIAEVALRIVAAAQWAGYTSAEVNDASLPDDEEDWVELRPDEDE